MIRLLRIVSTSVNSKFQRVVKMIGSKSTLTAEQYGPYGVDSNPVKDTTAIYITTERDGDESVIGVLNKQQKAEVGETRFFCTDAQGNFKFNIWLKADGTMLAGDSDVPAQFTNFMIKYNEYKTENDKLKSTVDALVTKWNAFCASYVPGSPSVTGSPPTLAASTVPANTSNFALAKNEKIKTN